MYCPIALKLKNDMKLIVVLSLIDYRERIISLFHDAGVKRFSTADITGYKDRKTADELNWFSSKLMRTKTNSIIFFSFAGEKEANEVVEKVNHVNDNSEDNFPIHAFIMNVEQFSKLL